MWRGQWNEPWKETWKEPWRDLRGWCYYGGYPSHQYVPPFIIRYPHITSDIKEMDTMFLSGEGVFKMLISVPVIEKVSECQHKYYTVEKEKGMVTTKQEYEAKLMGMYTVTVDGVQAVSFPPEIFRMLGTIHARIAHTYGFFTGSDKIVRYTILWRRIGTSEWKEWFYVDRNVPVPTTCM